mmetsp:Transcript_15401/g.42999  ORF Transcript_15401/g.42999 Transcript_15401/m.42999 type:complete len:652 (+) Transcript_15401:80-2035(+)
MHLTSHNTRRARPPPRSLTELPPEILSLVMGHCTDQALCSLSCCCTTTREVSAEVWVRRLHQRYPHSSWGYVRSARDLCLQLRKLDNTRWDKAYTLGDVPADRGGQASAHVDSGIGRVVVVHGGSNGPIIHGDSFALVPTQVAYKQTAQDGCTGRGTTSSCSSQTRTPSFRWTCLSVIDGPSPRWSHTAASIGTDVLVYGGSHFARGSLDDVYILDCALHEPKEWNWLPVGAIEIQGTQPGRRHSHACTTYAGAVWISGGIISRRTPHHNERAGSLDIFSATITRTPASKLSCSLGEGLSCHAGSLRPGGLVGRRISWIQHTPQGPQPRWRFGHTLSDTRAGLLMFGGRQLLPHRPLGQQMQGPGSQSPLCNDLWILRGAHTVTNNSAGSPASQVVMRSALSAKQGACNPRTLAPNPRLGGSTRPLSSIRAVSGCSQCCTPVYPRLPAATCPPFKGRAGELAPSKSSGLDSLAYEELLRPASLYWERIDTRGTPPCARAFHSCVSMGDLFIIMGGEGEAVVPGVEGPQPIYLSDVHALDLIDHYQQPNDAHAAISAVDHQHTTLYKRKAETVGTVTWRRTGGTGLGQAGRLQTLPWWRQVTPRGSQSAPPGSLATLSLMDSTLIVFGGFNNLADADLSDLHVVQLASSSCE